MADSYMVVLRAATRADAGILHAWRNEAATRSASHDQETIPWEDHVAWLEHSLADDSRKLLIAEVDGRAVGTVRADLRDGAWELSWTVAPEARGQGIASIMVRCLVDSIDAPVSARVRAGNTASVRVATRVGLRFQSEAAGILYFVRPALSTGNPPDGTTDVS
jgi:RimJ/RimL family protein N-acetyltransferase